MQPAQLFGNRRDFLKLAVTASGMAVLPKLYSAPKIGKSGGLIDVNVYLSHWPLRRVPGDETQVLVKMLREKDVMQAWIGSFDGLLQKDIAAVNTRLANECRQHG